MSFPWKLHFLLPILALSMGTAQFAGAGSIKKFEDRDFSSVLKDAEAGDTKAMCFVARYYDQKAMPRDHVKADLWFKRFAKKLESRTDPDTLTSLGYLYEKGEGVPKDLDRANDLYERAAISRNPSALFNLGLLCLRDDWPKRNPMKAVQAFARAAAIGSPGAQYMLASCFYKGIGVPKDRKKSFEWLNKAAEGGDMTAESVLGLFYDSGKYGVEIDLGLAKKWYQKAAAQGDYTSQQRLGHLMDPR